MILCRAERPRILGCCDSTLVNPPKKRNGSRGGREPSLENNFLPVSIIGRRYQIFRVSGESRGAISCSFFGGSSPQNKVSRSVIGFRTVSKTADKNVCATAGEHDRMLGSCE